MRTLSSPVLTALAGKSVGLAQLVELDLDIPWFVNTSGWNLNWNSQLYLGTAGAGRIDAIEDVAGEIKALKFELPAVIDTDLATAMLEMPQGRGVRLLTAVFDPISFQIVDAVLEWAGRLDVPQIAESDSGSVIQVSAEHIGIDLLRPSGLMYSHADQQRLHPGDNSFQYVVDQTGKKVIWPAMEYFRK